MSPLESGSAAAQASNFGQLQTDDVLNQVTSFTDVEQQQSPSEDGDLIFGDNEWNLATSTISGEQMEEDVMMGESIEMAGNTEMEDAATPDVGLKFCQEIPSPSPGIEQPGDRQKDVQSEGDPDASMAEHPQDEVGRGTNEGEMEMSFDFVSYLL